MHKLCLFRHHFGTNSSPNLQFSLKRQVSFKGRKWLFGKNKVTNRMRGLGVVLEPEEKEEKK